MTISATHQHPSRKRLYVIANKENGFLLYNKLYDNLKKARKDKNNFGSKKYAVYKLYEISFLGLLEKA